ncbi:hypothetical protein [Cedecea neteri]|uniref:hypothetical protein n=1 Tax=Cedecea neteri TaxID=158822 RepID=UPI0028A260E0|nr:hypothetical protein [Cedecea neteri]
MKLIDLLVQELPKHGGWPCGSAWIEQASDGRLFDKIGEMAWPSYLINDLRFLVADDWVNCRVSRAQYESALSASDVGRAGSSVDLTTEWNGEGLPPVGCECEMAWSEARFEPCKILYIGEESVMVKLERGEDCYTISTVKFRPTRSEADRKRDEAASSIQIIFDNCNEEDDELANFGKRLVQEIAAGKIPGIRIE